jgi:hypothetical protein
MYMMKKSIFLMAFAAAIFLSTTGCGEDLLNKSPYAALSEATFYQTETDAVGAVNAIYGSLTGIYNGMHFLSSSIWSDDFEKGGGGPTDGAYLEEMNNFQIVPSNSMAIDIWNSCYRGIFRANKAIEKIEDMNIADKDRLLCESKFLRALYYYNLNIRYNGVPLIMATGTADIKNVVRASAQEIWTSIEQDLKDAAGGLPASYSGADIGRPTKSSAQGLLGRVYLYMKEWQKAADVYADVINSGTCHLMDHYGDLFKNLGSDNLPESLFEVQSAAGKNSSSITLTRFMTPRDVNGWGGWGFCVPTRNLVDEFETGDLRRPETVAMEGDLMFGIPYESSWSPYTGFNPKKYVFGPEVATDETDCNMKVIRYAEVLLGYAEAILNGAAEKANITGLQAINKVRERAGLQAISALSFDAIVHERRVELALEGFRFHDLVRWGIAKEVLGADFNVNHDEYMPIPLNEILLNPNLEQNPGY